MNLKIYRKLLILAFLSIGLFVASSINTTKVAAEECCDYCNYVFNECYLGCQSYPLDGCEDACFNEWLICFNEPCNPSC